MYYTRFNFLNKFIDRVFDKFEEPLLRRRYVARRFKDLEYARKHGAEEYSLAHKGRSIGSWSTVREDNYKRAAWEYAGRVLTTLVVILAVAVPITLKVLNNHQRSLANASLWSAVQANNKATDVVSPSTVAVTMPCKATKTVDNSSDFTGASYSCDYLNPAYSTKGLSTSEIAFGADGHSVDLNDALSSSIEDIYSFEADTMQSGVSPQPYLQQCVSSTQNPVNASDIPGEVMNVAYVGGVNAQALGRVTDFSICELIGTKGTVTISAETVQNDTIVQLGILTDSSQAKEVLNKLTLYLDSVRYE